MPFTTYLYLHPLNAYFLHINMQRNHNVVMRYESLATMQISDAQSNLEGAFPFHLLQGLERGTTLPHNPPAYIRTS